MTSRVESRSLLVLLALLQPAGLALAQGETVVTPDALVVHLTRGDLFELGRGLEDVFGETPVAGRYDERLEQPFWWGSIAVEGITYSFGIDDVRMTPEDGMVRAAVTVKDLAVNVERVEFNVWGTMYCSDVPMSSGEGRIPVATDAVAVIDGKDLRVTPVNTAVGLDDANFVVGMPASCHTIWGLNWLVRRMVPWMAGVVRDRVADGIQQALADATETLADSLNDILQVSVTLPFGIEPAPAFYATLSLWPSALDLTADHFRFVVGADILFDPDVTLRDEDEESLGWLERLAPGTKPSYLGIGRDLLAAIIAEANRKGLFKLIVDRDTMPAVADLLNAGRLANVIPDAGERFAPEAPLSIAFDGAATTDVQIDPNGPGGIPIIEVILSGLAADLRIDGEPYYELLLDTRLQFELGYKRSNRQLSFSFIGAKATVRSGAFAAGLEPEPVDTTFDEERFAAFVAELSGRLSTAGGQIMAMTLPDLAVGTRQLELSGSSLRDSFLTLDATVTGP